MLQNGTFDFECGSTTNNLERQKQAAFSDTIFVVGTRLLVKKGGPIKDFPDLKDKAVVVTSGTTSEILLHKLNDEKNEYAHYQRQRSWRLFPHPESGRAVAFMMDDALLLANAPRRRNRIIGKSSAPRSRRKPMAACCGRTIRRSRRWLMKPSPVLRPLAKRRSGLTNGSKPDSAKNLNLNFELSDDMKALFKSPNDKALN